MNDTPDILIDGEQQKHVARLHYNATFVKDFNWGNHKGLPLQIMILCRGNPLWLPLT